MQSDSVSVQAGLDALKQGRYAEAIAALTTFLQRCPEDAQSKEFWQAKMGMARAHHRMGNHVEAIAQCQQLLKSSNPQVKSWAEQALQSLPSLTAVASAVSPAAADVAVPVSASADLPASAGTPPDSAAPAASTPELSPEEVKELFKQGSSAMRRKDYAVAIALLEQVCRGLSPRSRDYAQAQMWLVKAYQASGQRETAASHCQQLTDADNQALQLWAKQFLLTLLPSEALGQMLQSVGVGQASNASRAEQADPTTNAGVKLKTLAELRRFYTQALMRDMTGLEAHRKITVRSLGVVAVVVGGIVLFVIGLILQFALPYVLGFPSFELWLILAAVIALVIVVGLVAWVAFFVRCISQYGRGFKSRVIQKLIDFIDENQVLQYSPSSSHALTLTAFTESQLFARQPDRFQQDDCVSGRIGQTDIFFSAICAESEISHESDDDERDDRWDRSRRDRVNPRVDVDNWVLGLAIALISRAVKAIWYISSRLIKGQRIDFDHFSDEVIHNEVTRRILFKGLFFKAEFNKQFQAKTIIIPDVAERFLGHLGTNFQAMNKRHGELIRLEDPEFERLFAVYGTDQVEARYILSTSLMQRLVNFRKKANRDVFISFINNQIFLAVKYNEDLFEPRLFKSMVGFAPIQDYFEVLQLMIGIVEELNLNLRIWSK